MLFLSLYQQKRMPMKQTMIKNVIISLLLHSLPIFTTMGDSTTANGKKINFYGKLETYTLQTKQVEQITFWNQQLTTQLFQAPLSVVEMIKSGIPQAKDMNEKEFLLADNPTTQGIVATVELREIQSLSTPLQKRILYKEDDRVVQEFIAIEITLHGGKGVYYLADRGDKIYCNEQSGKETVELEVPITSIKKITIEGFLTIDQGSS
jgi:hypothetical protein